MKVFIADDSAVVRKRLSEMISRIAGVEVVGEAQDAHTTIESILKLEPDVVILDIRMPGGNGITVLEKIKKTSFNTVVIMVTNYPYPQYREKCMELGADYFFDKSSEFEKIKELLKQLIQDSHNENQGK